MHRGRLGAGRVGGLAPSIQMGRFHVRNVLPGQWLSGKVPPALPLAEWLDVIAEAGVCIASVSYSVPGAQGTSELKDHVPGKCMAIPWRIYTS